MPGSPAMRRLLSGSGIAGATVFALSVLIAGALHPHYSHISQAISELGAKSAPYRDFLNYGGLIPAGVLTFLFAVAMFSCLRGNSALRVSAGLVAVVGLGRLLAGLFPCDPGCSSFTSTSSRIHAIAGFIALAAGALAPIAMAVGLWTQRSRRMFVLSLVFGVGALAVIGAGVTRIWMPYVGAMQRLLLIFTYAWIIAVGLYYGAAGHPSVALRHSTPHRKGNSGQKHS